MKLISMVDFCIQQCHKSIDEYNGTTIRYAHFLKKKLELAQFIPCDKKGDVLAEIYDQKIGNAKYGLSKEYKHAREQVLFKGFTIHPYSVNQFNKTGKYYTLQKGDFKIFIDNFFEEHKSIESLIKYNLELTDNAIKALTK